MSPRRKKRAICTCCGFNVLVESDSGLGVRQSHVHHVSALIVTPYQYECVEFQVKRVQPKFRKTCWFLPLARELDIWRAETRGRPKPIRTCLFIFSFPSVSIAQIHTQPLPVRD